ncbi:hypothetical protein M378DRAFT_70063 [Amanita muscaria Koide BX008]|uniref:Magnesium transporter n=1 Tax=Amanita muscaria (strain Koide BX008) TaxID=946122 RepID=A0A0C2TPX8_AMAMK|nr:hypothetical protein M378DRAFT_70063 [Amanita muscaria Koide BX008]
MLGRILLLLASLTVFHDLSLLKALGQPESQLPRNIFWEAIISLILGVAGASFNAPQLKEITWASEMRKRKLDEVNSRAGFATYVTRGRNMNMFPPKSLTAH